MRKYAIVSLMLLIIQFANAQPKIAKAANTSVINLVILNDNGDILVKKASIGWITIGAFYEKRHTINEVIDSISNRYGVSIAKPNLKGVFTYKFSFNNSLSVRQVYVARSTTNDLPANKNVEFRWAPKEEAVEKFKATIPSLGEMVDQIITYPDVVWGGSFLIDRKNGKNNSTITEDFYPISDASTYREQIHNSRVDSKEKQAVLFVVSNAHYYANTDIPTGNSFSEIVNAYDVFKKANYAIDFVSPKGGAVPLTYINTSDQMSKKYLYDTHFMNALKNTKSPSEIDASNYKAVQYIGGGAAMFGVPENKEIQTIAMDIYEKYKGVLSSVCHGTAGIVNLKTKDGKYVVDGKSVSGYPDDYENKAAPYFKTFPFLIKKTIEERGGNFKFSERGKFTLAVDGRLVTGQNFQSSKPVSLKIIELINAMNK
ncbi:type 1 glutamine amidotransferase domain-containing protein [uncultured Croceitalea sp.]|uniref:type 1 glutamine amidotransferase domain-containing protein n=1 Tax=uncultured Croceitalea sp. TaxID=1798908 RepID=UPI003305D5D4